MKLKNFIILFTFISFGSSAKTIQKDEVEKVLSIVLKRNEMLLTLGGMKPFSISIPGETGDPIEDRKLIESYVSTINQATKQKLLTNSQIQFFVHPTWGAHIADHNYQMTIVNREAVERLLSDTEVIELLRRNSIKAPRSANEMIQLYKSAVASLGFQRHGPPWANLVVGVSLGYDPSDVEMHSHQKHLPPEKIQPGMIVQIPGDATTVTGYRHYGTQLSKRNIYFQENGRKILDNYQAAINQGKSYIELFNHPEQLRADLPNASATTTPSPELDSKACKPQPFLEKVFLKNFRK